MPKKHKRLYWHLTQANRDRLQAMRDEGTKQEEIAKILKVDPSTISREITRNRRKYRKKKNIKNRNARYEASAAHHKAYVRRKYAKYQGKKINENDDLKKYIVKGLKKHWGPDEISGRMKLEKKSFYASKTAVYEWLRTARGSRFCRYLCSKRYYAKKRKTKKPAKSMIPNRISIHDRPASTEMEYGHYEADTFVSGRITGGKAAVSVAVERRADYIKMKKIRRMKPKLFAAAVRCMQKIVIMKSATLDNGLENRDHETIGTKTFFCDPYSSWQKPHVENAIRLVRRFIPKRSDIDKVPETKIARVARILNHKPRKSLGYKTPYEIMVEQKLFIKMPTGEIALRG